MPECRQLGQSNSQKVISVQNTSRTAVRRGGEGGRGGGGRARQRSSSWARDTARWGRHSRWHQEKAATWKGHVTRPGDRKAHAAITAEVHAWNTAAAFPPPFSVSCAPPTVNPVTLSGLRAKLVSNDQRASHHTTWWCQNHLTMLIDPPIKNEAANAERRGGLHVQGCTACLLGQKYGVVESSLRHHRYNGQDRLADQTQRHKGNEQPPLPLVHSVILCATTSACSGACTGTVRGVSKLPAECHPPENIFIMPNKLGYRAPSHLRW